MPIIRFLFDNARWIVAGFLLTFFSAFGQTYFISLSAGAVRDEFGLSHGGFGTLYMVATLASALTLPWLGRIVDWYSTRKVVFIVVPALAAACAAMTINHSLVALAVIIYLLRLFGQGMMTQTAFTATARWFVGSRGRAISLVTLGHNVGEAIFPLLFVVAAGVVGWRGTWAMAAGLLIVFALPVAGSLIRGERQPRAGDKPESRRVSRDWTRGEVLRDPLFHIILAGVLAPGFIGTTIFFHQIYLVELRGWSLESFAASFALMSLLTITFALVSGHLVDRFSAVSLLPGFLVPLSLACLVLGLFDGQWSAFAFMALLGMSYGISSTLFGALWPELYGLEHLGSIRSIVVAFMVFATAMGPGITGYLIDIGVSYPVQIVAMGFYCIVASAVLFWASRRLMMRMALEAKPA